LTYGEFKGAERYYSNPDMFYTLGGGPSWYKNPATTGATGQTPNMSYNAGFAGGGAGGYESNNSNY
jgi:hypothetical protein